MNKINLSMKKEDTKHPPIIKHENERFRKNKRNSTYYH